MRDRLIELIKQKTCHYGPPCDGDCGSCTNIDIYDDLIEALAEHLLANVVIVLPDKMEGFNDPVGEKGECGHSTDCDLVNRQKAEIERLKEIEYMYNDLCK